MSTTTLTILDQTIHGQASGNYDGSSLEFYSDPAKAVGYYRGQGFLETATIQVLGFEGLITLQATLDADVDNASWFDIIVYGYGDSTALTDYHPITLTGNFTWVRAYVSAFINGNITGIILTY